MLLPPSFLRARRASALVIVLSCIALMTVLVVAFLASVTVEMSSSSGYASGNDARQKSQLAVNLAMAQIQDATGTNPAAPPTPNDPPVAWASQPGLIRTYDAVGRDAKQYKLYSASTMVETAFKPVGAGGEASDVDAAWYSQPAAFVDLNSPVTDLSGQLNYPILDPGALITTSNPNGVHGFAIDSTNTPRGGTTPNPAPMPVRWMYVLKDGKLRTAGADGKTVTDATTTNPIVSRFAFWTDDDTCKVNVNTAAGDLWDVTKDSTYTGVTSFIPGSFAALPLGSNFTETKLRLNQPLQHEYQRYPGHPATTYLSAVFPDLTRANIFDLAPKISPDSSNTTTAYSKGGTVPTSTSTAGRLPFAKASHLYASVDEVRFRTKSEAASTKRSQNNDPADGAPLVPVLTPDRVKKGEFFLTAHSRAPEVNLFNKPRVTIWPEDSNPSYRTTFDNNIALCSTVGGRPFYFVRDSTNGNTSSTVDINLTNASWSNLNLYAYLHNLMDTSIPGFGGSFAGKYDTVAANERDQILTEIFDYIRCTNLIDVSYNASDTLKSHPYAGKAPPNTSTQDRSVAPGNGFVVPTYLSANDTMGFGRAFTLYTPILEFYAMNSEISAADMTAHDTTKDGKIDLDDGKDKVTGAYHNTLAKIKTKSIQAVLLMDNFSVSHGVVRFTPNLDYVVTGLDGLSLNGTPMGFSSSATATFQAICGNNEYAWGGLTSAANLFMYWDGANKQVMTAAQYPLKSAVINLDSEYRQPLNFKGGKVDVQVYARSRSGVRGDLIQTIHLNFQDTKIPTPVVQGCVTYNGGGKGLTLRSCTVNVTPATDYYSKHGGESDGSSAMVNPGWQPNFDGMGTTNAGIYLWDATRSLTPSHGDMRLVAARHDVDESVFVPAPGCTYNGNYLGGGYFDPVETSYGFTAPKGNVASGPFTSKWIEPYSGGMVNGLPRTANGGGKWASSGWLVPQNLLKAAGSVSVKNSTNTGTVVPADNGYDMHFASQDYQMGPAVQDGINGAFLVNNARQTLTDSAGNPCLGDWDNGMAGVIDGPYINKPDEGEMGVTAYSSYSSSGNPYMVTATLFSPNRQVPSPVIFGSLSTGVKASKPWQTLLFNPVPEGKTYHPGFGTPAGAAVSPPLGPLAKPPFDKPPDHLLLDLFTMPIVEPYAISEPFSTAGKINMNFQIVPFTYLERSTGMQAVLASARVGAIPTNEALNYKPAYLGYSGPGNGTPYRYAVDMEETLAGFRTRFGKNDVFRSASQICEMPLIPAGKGLQGLHNNTASELNNLYAYFWDKMLLTGDNMREQPYANLYGRLTTKSNSYTVHVWSQTLKKVPGTTPSQWVEGKDQVTGEYRGSYEIERFLDPNIQNYDPALPLTAYKFRTVNSKQFTP